MGTLCLSTLLIAFFRRSILNYTTCGPYRTKICLLFFLPNATMEITGKREQLQWVSQAQFIGVIKLHQYITSKSTDWTKMIPTVVRTRALS